LKRLMELKAPDIIVRTRSACCRKPSTPCSTWPSRPCHTGANKRPLKSLADMLKGKQGRFPAKSLG